MGILDQVDEIDPRYAGIRGIGSGGFMREELEGLKARERQESQLEIDPLVKAQMAVRNARKGVGTHSSALTEEQQGHRGRLRFYGFLAGAHQGGLGGALMGMSEAPRAYEDAMKYRNYLDKRLSDPSLSASQRDALMARRHNAEKYSSTDSPWSSYGIQPSYSLTTIPVAGESNMVRRVAVNRRDPDDVRNVGGPFSRFQERQDEDFTLWQKHKIKESDSEIASARRTLENRSSEDIAQDIQRLHTGRADNSTNILYATAMRRMSNESWEDHKAAVKVYEAVRSLVSKSSRSQEPAADAVDAARRPQDPLGDGNGGDSTDADDEVDAIEAKLRAQGLL